MMKRVFAIFFAFPSFLIGNKIPCAYSLREIPEFIFTHGKSVIPNRMVVLPASLFENKLVLVSASPFDGGSSTSYTSTYQDQPVHLKVISNHPNKRMNDEFISSELYFYQMFSDRNMAAPLLGITYVNGETAIVTEKIEPVAFIKLLVSGNMSGLSPKQKAADAVEACPSCRSDWVRNIRIMSDFLQNNQIHAFDPQFMLLPDGRIYLYDFGTYFNEPTAASKSPSGTGIALDEFATLLETAEP